MPSRTKLKLPPFGANGQQFFQRRRIHSFRLANRSAAARVAAFGWMRGGMILEVGSTLGPYELLVPIAQGGMAQVWAARLTGRNGFQKIVALKSMHAFLSEDARFEQMFLSEAEFASRIQHPNVCSIHDLGEERGRLYLAMEWVDGDTLIPFEIAHPEGAPIEIAARIVADVALGLHALHELGSERGEPLGLVHCDVSPQNVLVRLDGVVKIVDFGLARATIESGRSPLSDARVGGKLSFMAPEQAQGGALDRRTDVFALGIVLYRLLTGQHPFAGETPIQRLQNMRDPSVGLTAPSELRATCPRALSKLVLRALERDPARRFATAAAFARALERALPEINRRACREELAALAERTVGACARQRRARIADAIRIADRGAAGDGEPISLPSSVLEELEHQPLLQTNRPVAFVPSPAPAPSRSGRITAMAVVAFALGLTGAALLAPRIDDASARAPALAARAIALPADGPRAVAVDRNPARARRPPAVDGSRRSSRRAIAAAPSAAPVASAVESAPDAGLTDWRLEPGF
jgi:eukaryotic-like serine/threonine-protein kinase